MSPRLTISPICLPILFLPTHSVDCVSAWCCPVTSARRAVGIWSAQVTAKPPLQVFPGVTDMRLRTSLFQRISLSLFFFVLVYALYRYPTEASAFISAAVPSNFKSVSESQRFVLTLEPVNDRSEVDIPSHLREDKGLGYSWLLVRHIPVILS
jgi:hypothetical protein